ALADHPAARHPGDDRLSGVYGVIFHDELDGAARQRNVTVFADGEVDRSPCGSGTAARLALLHEDGLRGPLRHESIVGTAFLARVAGVTAAGVFPEIEGMAWRTRSAPVSTPSRPRSGPSSACPPGSSCSCPPPSGATPASRRPPSRPATLPAGCPASRASTSCTTATPWLRWPLWTASPSPPCALRPSPPWPSATWHPPTRVTWSSSAPARKPGATSSPPARSAPCAGSPSSAATPPAPPPSPPAAPPSAWTPAPSPLRPPSPETFTPPERRITARPGGGPCSRCGSEGGLRGGGGGRRAGRSGGVLHDGEGAAVPRRAGPRRCDGRRDRVT